MNRMKTFFKYFLIFVIFYIVSDVISYMLLKSNYISKAYEIEFEEPEITITEMKSTVLNGYTKGFIKNNTRATLLGKALKLDYYSKNGVLVGTKYCEIGKLLAGETANFESRFNFDNVDSLKVSLVNLDEIEDTSGMDFSLDDWAMDDFELFIFLGALIMVFG